MNSNYRSVKDLGMAAMTLCVLVAAVILAGMATPARAQTETLLHQFTGSPDGANPYAGVALKGTTLYGTTMQGGTGPGSTGNGIVYKLTTAGKETILHTFTGQPDGAEPYGGVVLDSKGNLYGTTLTGGAHQYGTIYEIPKNGAEVVLYSFGGSDGAYPYYVTPVLDKLGNLYGTTAYGGYYGNGTVFKLSPNGTLTTLHSFNSAGGDGYYPDAGVVLDAKGNLYGSAPAGGTYGYGILFEITMSGAYSILYNFTGGADGLTPRSPVVFKGGSLYGTTQAGGAGCTWGCGVVFKFTPAKGKKAAKETVLHTFAGVPDGMSPMYGALVFDKLGNIYGTTQAGGAFAGGTNLGTVYKLAPDGTITILYNFDQQPNGYAPCAGVALDTKGNVYTTAAFGGNYGGQYGGGTVIKVTP